MSGTVKVLIVDDSAFLRHRLSKHLEAEPDLCVVGQAVDGLDALEKIPQLEPDVVVLDVEMPRMDGLTALQRIMTECPRPVVMLSALTQRGARTTIQALMRGAFDFVPKPDVETNITGVVAELAAKLRLAAGAPVLPSHPAPTPVKTKPSPAAKPPTRGWRKGEPVIVIGASTGGPRALQHVLGELPGDLPAAIAVVQHMPPAFTCSLAQRINEQAAIAVQEANANSRLEKGLALVAPGDYNLRFGERGQVLLDRGERRNHVRPSLDITMESAAEQYGSAVIGVVLTGMGYDGKQGAASIKAAGGKVIAEHESSCVIYGMPRSVVEAGLADQVLPLPQIAAVLAEWVGA